MADLATVGVEFQSRGAEALKTDLAQAGRASKETQAGLDGAARSGENLDRTSRQLADQLGRLAQKEQQAKRDLDLLDAALKRGRITQQQYAKAVGEVDRNLRRLGTSADAARNALRGVGSSGSLVRGGLQNVSFQIQDIAVQLQAGQDAAIVFGQQLPQLLGGFGAIGAAAGAAFAVAAPLASSLMDLGDGAEELDDAVDGLRESVSLYVQAANEARLSSDKLSQQYGITAGAAREIAKANEDLARGQAIRALTDAASELADAYSDARIAATELADFDPSAIQQGRIISPGGLLPGNESLTLESAGLELTTRGAIELAEAFGVTTQQAEALQEALNGIGTAQGPEAQRNALSEVFDLLRDSGVELEKLEGGTNDFTRAILDALLSAEQLVGELDSGTGAADRLADAARAIADEMANAASAASNMLSSAQAAFERAQIRQQFVGDPVGEAGALAGFNFDQRLGDTSGFDPVLQEGLASQREELVGQAEATAALTAETRALEKALRDAERPSGGRGGGRRGGGGNAAREAAREARELEQLRTAYENLVGSVDDVFQAETRRERGLDTLSEALQRGVIDQQEFAEASRLVEREFVLATNSIEAAAQRVQDSIDDTLDPGNRFEDTFGALDDALTQFLFDPFDQGVKGMVLGFSEALRQMAAEALSAQIVQQLLGFVGGFGGGGGGGALLGTLPFFDSGGFIPGGKSGIVAERRPEFVDGELISAPSLVRGPANVTSGAETARILESAPRGASAAPRVTVNNIFDPAIIGEYLSQPAAEKILVNTMRKNGFRQA